MTTYAKLFRVLTIAVVCLLPISTMAADNTSGVKIPAQPKYDKSDAALYGLALARYADAYDVGWRDQYSKSTLTLYDARGCRANRRIARGQSSMATLSFSRRMLKSSTPSSSAWRCMGRRSSSARSKCSMLA